MTIDTGMLSDKRATEARLRMARIEVANAFLVAMARRPPHVFRCDGRVARLELDDRLRVRFHDDFSQRLVDTHRRDDQKWPGFSHGMGAKCLVICLRDFVMGRVNLPSYAEGRWPGALELGRFAYSAEDAEGVHAEVALAVANAALPYVKDGRRG